MRHGQFKVKEGEEVAATQRHVRAGGTTNALLDLRSRGTVSGLLLGEVRDALLPRRKAKGKQGEEEGSM